jgi:hypothetical protein
MLPMDMLGFKEIPATAQSKDETHWVKQGAFRPRGGVSGCVKQILWKRLSKVQQMSNWGAQNLCKEQINYAGKYNLMTGAQ